MNFHQNCLIVLYPCYCYSQIQKYFFPSGGCVEYFCLTGGRVLRPILTLLREYSIKLVQTPLTIFQISTCSHIFDKSKTLVLQSVFTGALYIMECWDILPTTASGVSQCIDRWTASFQRLNLASRSTINTAKQSASLWYSLYAVKSLLPMCIVWEK